MEMSDLISRELLTKEIINRPTEQSGYNPVYLNGCATRQNESMNIINDMPTVEAVPKSYAEQIRWERDVAVGQLNEIGCQFGQKMDEVKDKLNSAKNWIPCSERLPENNNPCLCWVKSTTIAAGETFIIGSCERGFWFLKTDEIGHHYFPVKDYKVVEWMPLPEPYKGEQYETD